MCLIKKAAIGLYALTTLVSSAAVSNLSYPPINSTITSPTPLQLTSNKTSWDSIDHHHHHHHHHCHQPERTPNAQKSQFIRNDTILPRSAKTEPDYPEPEWITRAGGDGEPFRKPVVQPTPQPYWGEGSPPPGRQHTTADTLQSLYNPNAIYDPRSHPDAICAVRYAVFWDRFRLLWRPRGYSDMSSELCPILKKKIKRSMGALTKWKCQPGGMGADDSWRNAGSWMIEGRVTILSAWRVEDAIRSVLKEYGKIDGLTCDYHGGLFDMLCMWPAIGYGCNEIPSEYRDFKFGPQLPPPRDVAGEIIVPTPEEATNWKINQTVQRVEKERGPDASPMVLEIVIADSEEEKEKEEKEKREKEKKKNKGFKMPAVLSGILSGGPSKQKRSKPLTDSMTKEDYLQVDQQVEKRSIRKEEKKGFEIPAVVWGLITGGPSKQKRDELEVPTMDSMTQEEYLQIDQQAEKQSISEVEVPVIESGEEESGEESGEEEQVLGD